jgi:hypothetical protein
MYFDIASPPEGHMIQRSAVELRKQRIFSNPYKTSNDYKAMAVSPDLRSLMNHLKNGPKPPQRNNAAFAAPFSQHGTNFSHLSDPESFRLQQIHIDPYSYLQGT